MFSYFRETAEYLYESLRADADWLARMGNPELAVISGSTDGERRKTIVNRFAPASNHRDDDEGVAWQPPADPIDILISTDVLSEGQNLQDCAELLNYDLHWNPVRMIQRAGRINRLRSLHEDVYIGNCFPDRDLNKLLGIVERLNKRIRDIDASVGLDHSVMGEVISEKSFEDLRRIKASDPGIVDELEAQSELTSLEDMKLPLQLFFKDEGEEALQRIPLGIRSARLGPKKGTFLAFKVPVGDRDHHFWRFYPDEEAPPVADMREIFTLIRCGRAEPRISVESPENPNREDRRFDVVERATADILHELRGRRGVVSAPYRMIALEKTYWNVLERPGLGEDMDAAMRERVMKALGRGSFRPLHRKHEWREVQQRWRRNELDSASLAAALDQIAAVWGLYNDLDFGAAGALAAINEEQLRLVCYELIV